MKALDWDYYLGMNAKLSSFATVRTKIDAIVSTIETLSPLEFRAKGDASRLQLDYYKVMDPIKGKRNATLHMFIHAWFLRHFFEVGGRLAQKSADTATSYFDRIVHSIQFPPMYYKAGMGILSHFNSILRQKYPDLGVKIRIEQDDLVVRMIIDTPEGTREIVEQALDKYMDVVRGDARVEDLLPDGASAMEMRHVMQMMRMTIEHQRDMLFLQDQRLREQAQHAHAQDRQLSALIGGHATLLNYVGDTITNVRDDAREWRELLLQQMETASADLKHALLVIHTAVERQKVEDDAEFRAAVERVQQERPGLLETIHQKVADAAISGVIGNAFYGWLVAILSALPKA